MMMPSFIFSAILAFSYFSPTLASLAQPVLGRSFIIGAKAIEAPQTPWAEIGLPILKGRACSGYNVMQCPTGGCCPTSSTCCGATCCTGLCLGGICQNVVVQQTCAASVPFRCPNLSDGCCPVQPVSCYHDATNQVICQVSTPQSTSVAPVPTPSACNAGYSPCSNIDDYCCPTGKVCYYDSGNVVSCSSATLAANTATATATATATGTGQVVATTSKAAAIRSEAGYGIGLFAFFVGALGLV